MRTALASLLVGCVLVPRATCGQDFRVDTEVYVEDQEQPLARIRTLFVGSADSWVAYDFILGKNEEITILDPHPDRNRILLLSVPRKQQTSVSLNHVLEMALAIRNRVPDDAADVFDPPFTVRQRQSGLTLESPALTYDCDGEVPKHKSVVSRYESFATWNARLNSLRPQNPPSFGRVKLNRAVAEKGWVPSRVRRVVKWRNRSGEARSEHSYMWQLSVSDRNRLSRVQEQLATFEQVPFDQFLGVKQAVKGAEKR